MPTLKFDFTAGRYHATPTGHHVNEGQIEWPPSPWRILRALISVGYTKLGWVGPQPPPMAVALLQKLSAATPRYALPAGGAAHSRHYMPQARFKGSAEATALVLDTFAHGLVEPLYVHWPAALGEDEQQLLRELLAHLSYLGRAESWVDADLLDDAPAGVQFNCEPAGRTAARGVDIIQVLAPLSNADYAQWYAEQTAPLLAPYEGLRKLTAKQQKDRTRALAPYPPSLIDALQQGSDYWQLHGWNQPPGSQRIAYQRPREALQSRSAGARASAATPPVEAILLALSTASGKHNALPPLRYGLLHAERIHDALVRLASDPGPPPPELTGQDGDRRTLTGHAHLYIQPLDLDQDQRIDHILLRARAGISAEAQAAIRRFRKLIVKGQEPPRVAIVGAGKLEDLIAGFAELRRTQSASHSWSSTTPFVPVRHQKARGRNTLANQIRDELQSHGIAAPLKAVHLAGPDRPDAWGQRATRLRHFNLQRQSSPPKQAYGYTLVLEFAEPANGPIAIGYGSHFGLGQFEAVDRVPEHALLQSFSDPD